MAKGKTPPGPRGDFLLGSTLDFKASPMEYMHYVARAYGDLARFRIGPSYWYLLCHPDDIHAAMTTQANIFLKPRIARRLWSKFLGDGVLTAEGDRWRRQSRMMRPAFHKGRIDGYAEVMVEYTQRMVDEWKPDQVVDFDEAMVNLTLEIVAKTLFDADVKQGAEQVGKAMHVLYAEMLEHIHMPLPVPAWWPSARNRRKMKAIADIEDIVKDIIEDRRRSGEDRGDLLSMLVMAKDENGEGLSDKELRDQSMTLFFAGHETTAHAMTWLWHLLAQHPEITARLQDDIHRVTGGAPLVTDHLASLPYLEMAVKEGMRILPSVWVFIKEPTEDVEMRGYTIPKGAQVAISPYVVQRDPRWFPQPETFDPERFSPERIKSIPNGAYVPFSGGGRICLGKSFAMMEARLIIGTLLQRLVPMEVPGYVAVKQAQLALRPRDGLPIVARFREGQQTPVEAVNT